jgi:hypothetical protein
MIMQPTWITKARAAETVAAKLKTILRQPVR